MGKLDLLPDTMYWVKSIRVNEGGQDEYSFVCFYRQTNSQWGRQPPPPPHRSSLRARSTPSLRQQPDSPKSCLLLIWRNLTWRNLLTKKSWYARMLVNVKKKKQNSRNQKLIFTWLKKSIQFFWYSFEKIIRKNCVCWTLNFSLQVLINNPADDDPNRMELLRRYAAIYGRFDSKRKSEKPMSLHEVFIIQAFFHNIVIILKQKYIYCLWALIYIFLCRKTCETLANCMSFVYIWKCLSF